MTTSPREIWSQLSSLLVTASVAVSGCGVPVSRVGVVHGDLVWDECCAGYLYARIIQMNVSTSFPQASTTPANCVAGVAALVEMGVLRCAPMMDNNGNPPSVQAQSDFARESVRDASILYNVITGYHPDWANYPLVINVWRPLSIEGGCGGGAWQFFMDVSLCPCGPA